MVLALDMMPGGGEVRNPVIPELELICVEMYDL